LELEQIQIVRDLSLNRFSVNSEINDEMTNNLEKDVMGMLEGFNLDLPSIFVIDEAHGLKLKKSEDGGIKYGWKFLKGMKQLPFLIDHLTMFFYVSLEYLNLHGND
jgi:hypothetical protein